MADVKRIAELMEARKPGEEILRVEDLVVHYKIRAGWVKAVEGAKFTLNRGDTMGLVGESGCGKTTTGYSIAQLLPDNAYIKGGKIYFLGEEILSKTLLPDGRIDKFNEYMRKLRWKRISYIFQGAMNALNPVLKVGDQIVEAILAHEKVDEDAANLEVANRSDLMVGAVVMPDVELVWILNSSSPRLFHSADRFLRVARKSGLVQQLVHNEFGSWKRHRRRSFLPIPDGALSPYDELLQWSGRQYDIDWRLLASLMYEESRFDSNAVGPGGSAGLFQFMPFTWRELGVEDPHDPVEAAEAAGRYLRRLMDGFGDLELPDRVAMALAAYNVGPRHVFDARRLAREMGLDPKQWLGSVETAMLLMEDPEVARRFPAGVCRCRRAVGYTRRILRRYAAYTEQFPPA